MQLAKYSPPSLSIQQDRSVELVPNKRQSNFHLLPCGQAEPAQQLHRADICQERLSSNTEAPMVGNSLIS